MNGESEVSMWDGIIKTFLSEMRCLKLRLRKDNPICGGWKLC